MIIAKKKKAKFDYEIVSKYEGGLVLQGWEVKSIRAGKIQLQGSFITFKKDELFLNNAHISKYMNVQCDETQARKILLHKKEIKKIKAKTQIQKLSIVPIALRWSHGWIKVLFGLGKPRKKHDKRNLIKAKDMERSMKRKK